MVEATEEAKKMGAPKAFNVIVLGAAAKHMGFEKEDVYKRQMKNKEKRDE